MDIRTNLTDSTPTWNFGVLIPSIAMMVLSIGAFSGNALIVGVVVKYRNFRSKYEALYLICFLAVTDFLMSKKLISYQIS